MTTHKNIQEVANKIAKKYQLEKIILFGSYAWGTPNQDSDVDLFIVADTKNTRETAMEIDGSVFPRPFPLDVMVCTPSQVEKRKEMGDFFIRDILTKGKVLYER